MIFSSIYLEKMNPENPVPKDKKHYINNLNHKLPKTGIQTNKNYKSKFRKIQPNTNASPYNTIPKNESRRHKIRMGQTPKNSNSKNGKYEIYSCGILEGVHVLDHVDG